MRVTIDACDLNDDKEDPLPRLHVKIWEGDTAGDGYFAFHKGVLVQGDITVGDVETGVSHEDALRWTTKIMDNIIQRPKQK